MPDDRAGAPVRRQGRAEIPPDGVAPAIANAVFDAIGVQVPVIPLTPERVWRALQEPA